MSFKPGRTSPAELGTPHGWAVRKQEGCGVLMDLLVSLQLFHVVKHHTELVKLDLQEHSAQYSA